MEKNDLLNQLEELKRKEYCESCACDFISDDLRRIRREIKKVQDLLKSF